MATSARHTERFDRSLLLVRWLADELGGRYNELLARVKDTPDSGAPGHSARLAAVLSRSHLRASPQELAQAERAFMADWAGIARARESATGERFALAHFQWLAALFVELYLMRLAAPGGRTALTAQLNALREQSFAHLPEVLPLELNRLALWMATGSGKTLMLHLNTCQFLRHAPGILGRAPQRVLLLTPNETLSAQHRAELGMSGLNDITLGRTLEITELTKLYLPQDKDGQRNRVKAGVSVSTDQYPGPNLLLVDEGHKGGKSNSGDESAFRERRQALTGTHALYPVEGEPGFEFEYSATFAQIADGDRGFFDDYARCTVFDYGYRRFHDDGFGKSPRSLVTRDGHAQDLVLAASLVAFWRQVRYFGGDSARAKRYRLAPPLAVFVGQSVTGKSQDVVQVLTFLARFAADTGFAHGVLAQVLDATNPIQQALFAAQLDLSAERTLGVAALHTQMCTDLFGGQGTLAVRALSKDELGIRLPGAQADRWFGSAYVGDAPKLAAALRTAGVTVEEADAVTGSLFARLDDLPEVKFLIGSRKFIEGWSSFRVSTLGLMKIGRNAGTQVIQLFGRGVRLAGVGGRLQRASHVPELGPHPAGIELGETLYVFGVKAEYIQTWLDTLSREGMPAQSLVVPVTPRKDLDALGLQVPRHDGAREAAFGLMAVRFKAAEQSPVLIDLSDSLTLQDGVGAVQVLQAATQTHPAHLFLARLLDAEALFQSALRFLSQQRLGQVWVTPVDAQQWLERVQACVPVARLPMLRADQLRLRHEVLAQWEAALARTYRRARLEFLTQQPTHDLLTQAHANFPLQTMPDGSRAMGYRVETIEAMKVAESVMEALRKGVRGIQLKPQGWDRILSVLREEAGEIDLKDTLASALQALQLNTETDALGLPLPRLHIAQHLYNPLLLAAPAASMESDGQLSLLDDQPVTLRISPPALENSEARLVWDVRRVWERLLSQTGWQGVEVVLLRNLSGIGVGLFAAEGFYPDFLLWLKQGDAQALAFVEPKGLRHQWPQDKFYLLEKVVPTWKFSVAAGGLKISSNSEADLNKIDHSWASAPSVLLHQDAEGRYVERLLEHLRALLPART
ncbi:DEAD/DEAH box helicase family protein [Rhodoferax sp.]|uniref:DEAD/DEAH box helicase family protein n=1 Tax=Rhodoferax sp. TaxID=50421 RepID=UPI001831CAAC|nr:DEAD/DEAH box helicase family protein [Rhodoferax sp.]MBA3058826.1 hypothetical protein [Rhodoferax sp.]